MTTAHAGWRLERKVQRSISKVSSGRSAAATEVLWSNRPLPRQGCLLELEAVGWP